MKILLLEDDQILSETLEHLLLREGYEVDIALCIEDAETMTYESDYDVYLFDIDLPEGTGLELLEALRHAEDKTPTIFITALIDMESMAKGFNLGAIDYIKKPFNPTELLLRLASKFKPKILYCQDIEYNEEQNLLRKNGKVIDIGNVQYSIFTILLENRGSIVTKEELYSCLSHESDTALRVAITKIKQRLDVDITNIRGKGYMIEAL